jgi:hypothetical protein
MKFLNIQSKKVFKFLAKKLLNFNFHNQKYEITYI